MPEKDRLEKKLADTRLLGDADYPLAWIVLFGLALLAVTALVTVSLLVDGHKNVTDARSFVVQLAGGVLVLIGAYTAARGVVNARVERASDLLLATLALLDSKSTAARIGAIAHLPTLARRRAADHETIHRVLVALRDGSADAPNSQAAVEALKRFPEERRAGH